MNWRCKTCEGSNAWWKSVCEGCGTALRGFEDAPAAEDPDPLLTAVRDAIEFVENQPMYRPPGGLLPSCRCAPLARCNNAACPNRIVTG